MDSTDLGSLIIPLFAGLASCISTDQNKSKSLSETVYREVVTSGLVIGAQDAAEVDKFCRSGQIVIFPSDETEEVPLDLSSELHRGELEAIRVALQISADYLLIDDFDARQVAEKNLLKVSAATTLKGTLWCSDRTVSEGVDFQISTERVSWRNKEAQRHLDKFKTLSEVDFSIGSGGFVIVYIDPTPWRMQRLILQGSTGRSIRL